MTRTSMAAILSSGIALAALGLGPTDAARARWDAFLSGDVPALAGAYAPGAELFFSGTPVHGFLGAGDAKAAWSALFRGFTPVASTVTESMVIPGTNTVIAALSVEASAPGGEAELDLVWAMAFDAEGRVTREDFLLWGLPGYPQAPRVDGALGEGEYPHGTEAAGVVFRWFNGTLLLFGALESPGTGWVAVGFAPESRMKGADIVFAWVKDGVATVEDHYAHAPTGHRRDRIPHVFRAAGTETDGGTTVEFIVPLSSGDPEDKDLERGKRYKVILAYHLNHDGPRRHTARGIAEMALD